jgi:hypothetical protein
MGKPPSTSEIDSGAGAVEEDGGRRPWKVLSEGDRVMLWVDYRTQVNSLYSPSREIQNRSAVSVLRLLSEPGLAAFEKNLAMPVNGPHSEKGFEAGEKGGEEL